MIAWSPLLIFPIAFAMLAALVNEPTGMGEFWAMAAVPVVLLAVAYAAVVLASTPTNQRSWPDRLAGTWLMIR